MKQSNGADDGSDKVCKLRKAIYGSPKSSCWYEKFDNFMRKRGYQNFIRIFNLRKLMVKL